MQPIRQVVGRARRRLRARAALEAGTAVVPLAAAAACVGAGPPLLGVIVAGGALVGAVWPRDDEAIARRIDRASNLADRLSTAIAFERANFSDRDPTTRAMAELAIADAIRVAPRADVRAATPFGVPRATRVAAASVMVAAVLAILTDRPPLVGVAGRMRVDPRTVKLPDFHRPVLRPHDVAYIDFLLEKARVRASSPEAVAWADSVEQHVVAASEGRLDRETLLQKLEGLAVPGEVGQAGEDVLEAIRQSKPPEPPPPPPPQPPPPPPPPNGPGPAPDDVGPEPRDGAGVGPSDDHGDDHAELQLGPETERDQPTVEKKLHGDRGEGPSRRQTLLSAAEKGFAAEEYRQVYAEYADIVEEVMRAEKVPSTRRYLIQRYFHWIRPGER